MQHSNQPPSNKSSPSFEYKYLGRLVTRERPVIRKSKSLHQNLVFPTNTYQYSMRSHRREDSYSSDDDVNDLTKPLGVIRINDRYFREIYRVPTPPPEIKRVFHRVRSPKLKIIERVYVHRPAPEIIENIIEVPPEKVRIINREKYLEKSKPIIRTKVIHLKPHHHHRHEEQQPTPVYYSPQLNPQMPNTPQSSNWRPIQASCYTFEPGQSSSNHFHGYSQ